MSRGLLSADRDYRERPDVIQYIGALPIVLQVEKSTESVRQTERRDSL